MKLHRIGPVEVVAVVVVTQANKSTLEQEMKMRGADKIALASCIFRGAPDYLGFPCPFTAKL